MVSRAPFLAAPPIVTTTGYVPAAKVEGTAKLI